MSKPFNPLLLHEGASLAEKADRVSLIDRVAFVLFAMERCGIAMMGLHDDGGPIHPYEVDAPTTRAILSWSATWANMPQDVRQLWRTIASKTLAGDIAAVSNTDARED
jgi:hypothetical protein